VVGVESAASLLGQAVDFSGLLGTIRVWQAGVAQLVEQLIRNQQVTRSSRVAGSKNAK
jgi:hypothetical protein